MCSLLIVLISDLCTINFCFFWKRAASAFAYTYKLLALSRKPDPFRSTVLIASSIKYATGFSIGLFQRAQWLLVALMHPLILLQNQ